MKPDKVSPHAETKAIGANVPDSLFPPRVATAEQVRMANKLLVRLRSEVEKTGWIPYKNFMRQ